MQVGVSPVFWLGYVCKFFCDFPEKTKSGENKGLSLSVLLAGK